MSAELLSGIVGIVWSLLFSYVPGLNTWYSGLSKAYKRAGMGILITLTALIIAGLSCADVIDYVTCDKAGLLTFAGTWISAMVANQGVYPLTKRSA